MMTDAKLAFVPIGTPLSLVGGAGVSFPSPLIYDFLGSGPGTPVTNKYGNSATPGQADAMGVGAERPELVVTVGIAATANAGSPTLNVQLQAAPDNGANQPGTWQTLGESGTITVAQLITKRRIARLPWLPPFPVSLRPRFIRLNFLIPAATSFATLTIASALVTTVRDDPFQLQAAKNYSVAGVL